MIIYDVNNNLVDINNIEKTEQDIAEKYILPDDTVLELGARYGSVSCIIDSKLNNKKNLVVVDPDSNIWNILEYNKRINNCDFNIIKGVIGNNKYDLIYNGYGTTSVINSNSSIKSYTLNEVKNMYNIKNFNVLVADCEGYLEIFLDENPDIYDNLRMITYEKDFPDKCNYEKIKNILIDKKFINILDGFHMVWINPNYKNYFIDLLNKYKYKLLILIIILIIIILTLYNQ